MFSFCYTIAETAFEEREMLNPLDVSVLYHRCDSSLFDFDTTDALDVLE
jgi:hypothetical protein